MMDSSFKQSSSFNRMSSIDVDQLDKVNAIPNKATDNVLMDGLCLEDRHYISALKENDSSDTDNGDGDIARRSTAWSPMIQNPIIMNKRMKKLRPAYAITLSLEEISYIRPSWGLSKGIRTIEINKKPIKKEGKAKKEKSEKLAGKSETALRLFLVILTLIIVTLIVTIYLVDRRREEIRIGTHRIKVNKAQGILEIFKYELEELNPIAVIQFAQGIPRNLKPSECTCKMFTDELRKYDNSLSVEDKENKTCVGCLDWAFRANLRVYSVRNPDSNFHCYDIQWQSYDNLFTPMIDCFIIGDEQWFGIGDVQASIWPLSKLEFDWTPVTTNLSVEFLQKEANLSSYILPLGSYANFSFLSTNGIFISNLNTDFKVSLRMSSDSKFGHRRLCLSASCSDSCGQYWPRTRDVNRYRFRNNILEYRICSSDSMKNLISNQIIERSQKLMPSASHHVERQEEVDIPPVSANFTRISERLLERESVSKLSVPSKLGLEPSNSSFSTQRISDGIGLIERIIFATSQEFMPVLDGQTLRQHVDLIVKLSLKTSTILLIDSRWETYVGSLKLNTALFPKAKLLFEILHNKGFKILFTIKPYIDTAIGVGSINQLLESGRLYSTRYNGGVESDNIKGISKGNDSVKTTITRRRSLFGFVNQSIEVEIDSKTKAPYMHRCKESRETYCVLIDLGQESNRAWFISNIKRSSILNLEADGIMIGGTHPNSFFWDEYYRSGVSELSKSLFYNEKIYVLPQWTGDFGYIQLAPRSCTWDSLKSIVNSVVTLNMMGLSLVHPGSVWGDLVTTGLMNESFGVNRSGSIYRNTVLAEEKASEELIIRWLQVSVFLPVLQFNNIVPIERHGIHDLVQNLVKIRKTQIVPELKKYLPYTPLISQTPSDLEKVVLPLIRPVWYGQEVGETIITEQFLVGPDILIAPIMGEGLRQRDIYLPSGFWRDELRQVNMRGGKWLRNYPVELTEIAWFTRARR